MRFIPFTRLFKRLKGFGTMSNFSSFCCVGDCFALVPFRALGEAPPPHKMGGKVSKKVNSYVLIVLLSFVSMPVFAFTAGTYTLNMMGQVFTGSDPLALCSSPAVANMLLGYNGGIPTGYAASGDAATVDCSAVFPAWSSVPVSFKTLSGSFLFVAAPVIDPASSVAAASSVTPVDVTSIVNGLAAVNASVTSLSVMASSVISAQSLSSPVTMTERSVLIILAGCFAFFTGYGLTKGYR